MGVTMTTSSADYEAQPPRGGSVPIEELARRKGVRPVESVEDMAQDGILSQTSNWRSSSRTCTSPAIPTSGSA